MHGLRIRPFWPDPETLKNNIRLLSPRGVELFSKLPEDMKIILGDVFNEEKWNEIKDSGIIPAYLADEGEGDEIEELLSDDLTKLNVLHEREELMDPNISRKDIPKLFNEVTSKDPDPAVRRRLQDNQVLEQLDEDGDLVDEEEDEDEVPSDPAGINVENTVYCLIVQDAVSGSPSPS